MSMLTQIKMFGVFFVSCTILALTKEVNGDYGVIKFGGRAIVLLVTFLSTIAYATFLAQQDSQRNIKGIHYIQATLRGILLAFVPVILWIQQGDRSNLTLILVGYTTFYVCFDLFYNSYKGEAPFYVGKEAATDRIVRWLNEKTFLVRIYPLWFILFKVGLFLLALSLVIRYYL